MPECFSAQLNEIKAASMPSVSYSFRKIYEADDGRARFISYLVELYHLARLVPSQLEFAFSRLDGTHPAVDRYLRKHREEEKGHDRWLLRDLQSLGIPRDIVERSAPAYETCALVGHHFYAIKHAPISILGHSFAFESDPEQIELHQFLADKLKIPISALFFLTEHAKVDVYHIAELTELLDSQNFTPEDEESIKHNLKKTLDYLADLFLSLAVRDHWAFQFVNSRRTIC